MRKENHISLEKRNNSEYVEEFIEDSFKHSSHLNKHTEDIT